VTASTALAEARRRDVARRRQQVRQALAEMSAQAAREANRRLMAELNHR
jgi:hypothetical protein